MIFFQCKKITTNLKTTTNKKKLVRCSVKNQQQQQYCTLIFGLSFLITNLMFVCQDFYDWIVNQDIVEKKINQVPKTMNNSSLKLKRIWKKWNSMCLIFTKNML